jgi:hypothetical protein
LPASTLATQPPRLWLRPRLELLGRETLLVGLGALVVFAGYAWSAGFWVDLVDEGYFLDLAARVEQGALPYRDFSTYYTPGVFYLYAAVFKLFGASVLPVRLLLAGVRALSAVLLYGLARRVVSPWFAGMPFLVVAALDHWPIEPEPHASWFALVGALLVMEAVARHVVHGCRGWLLLAGAAAGMAFLFKQNAGAFACLGLAGYVLLRGPTGARLTYVATTTAAVTVLLWPGLDGLCAAVLLLPLLLTLVLLLSWPEPRPQARRASWHGVAREAGLALGGFVGVTLLWLVPLLVALGPGNMPLSLFLGSVNLGALAEPFAPPTRGTPAVLLAAVWLPVLLAPRRSQRALLLAGALSLLLPMVPLMPGSRGALTDDPAIGSWLHPLDDAFGTLHLYLPALAAWAAVSARALTRASRLAGPRGQPHLVTDQRLLASGPLARHDLVPWFLLFGTLCSLALYPRVDTGHVLVAGPPVLIAGAWAVSQAWHGLVADAARWRQVLVSAALLLVPVVALAPQVGWRYANLVTPPGSKHPTSYVPLELARAPVLVPRQMAQDIGGVVDLVGAGTPPGGAFFAYPVAPLFNFLADRPNPSRFDHFLPGALTPADVDEVVTALEAARPKYVLWDHGGLVYWGTDPVQFPLTTYIWRCYRQVTAFHFYLLLERQAC